MDRSADDDQVAVNMRLPWRTSEEVRAPMDTRAFAKTRSQEDALQFMHADTSQWSLWLAYAITYFYAQGKTVKGRSIIFAGHVQPPLQRAERHRRDQTRAARGSSQ